MYLLNTKYQFNKNIKLKNTNVTKSQFNIKKTKIYI